MANDLSDLDHASPGASDLVSQGDDVIRETRQKVKNWAIQDLGNTNAEHYSTGPHRFPVGNYTPGSFAIPAGNSGRIAYDTTNARIVRDDGSTWTGVHALGLYAITGDGPTVINPSPSFTTLVSINPVVCHSGAAVVVLWSTTYVSDAINQLFVQLLVNGVTTGVYPGTHTGPEQGVNDTTTISGMFHYTTSLTTGNNTFALQAAALASATDTCSSTVMRVLVL